LVLKSLFSFPLRLIDSLNFLFSWLLGTLSLFLLRVLEARAADRNLYLVIKSNIAEPVVNVGRGGFVKDRRSRRTGPPRVEQQRSSAFKSHPNYYSRLHTWEQTAHVGRGDVEREGENLELNQPDTKINFCSVENQGLHSVSCMQRYTGRSTPGLPKDKRLGVAGQHSVDPGEMQEPVRLS